MKKRKRRVSIVPVFLIAAASIAACQHDSPSGPSSVSILLTDAPIDLTGVSAVNVTLSGLVLYPSGDHDDGGIQLDDGPIALPGELTINLLDFRDGQTTFLGSAEVPPGTYNRIRLQVESAELVRDDDANPDTPDVVEPITVPSSKVDVVVPFDLDQGEDLTLTLDFDAQASVQVNQTGNGRYLLRPVINLAHSSSSRD